MMSSNLYDPLMKDFKFYDFFEQEFKYKLQDAVSSFSGIISSIVLLDGTPLSIPLHFCGSCSQNNYSDDFTVVKSYEASCDLESCEKVPLKSVRCKQFHYEPVQFKCINQVIWEKRIPIEVENEIVAHVLVSRLHIANLDLKLWEQCFDKKLDCPRKPLGDSVLNDDEFNRIVEWLTKFVDLTTQLAYRNYMFKHLLEVQRSTNVLLLKSQEHQTLILESAQEGIVVLQDGCFQYVNPIIEYLTGYSKNELLFSTFDQFIHEADRDLVFENYTKRMQGNEITTLTQFRLLLKGGSVKWVEVSVRIIEWEGNAATLNFLTDITSRKAAEVSLIESEEKYRLIAENTSDGILSFSPDGTLLYASPAYSKLIGRNETDPAKLCAEVIYQIIHPQDRDKLFEDIYGAIASKKTEHTYTYRVKCDFDNYSWREDSAKFRYDSQGNYLGSYVICRDINSRIESEQKLRISEANLAEAQSIARIGSWEWNSNTNQFLISKEMIKLFDIDPATFDGKMDSISTCIQSDDVKLFNSIVYSEEIDQYSDPIEVRVNQSDGTIRYMSIIRKSELDDNSKLLKSFGVVQDITERIIADKEKKSHKLTRLLLQHDDLVRENERLSISDELHDDLGQVLTAVKMEIELLKQSTSHAAYLERFDKTVSMVSDTIRSIQRITAQLRPNILDELGIKEAVEWLTIDYSNMNNISIVTEIDPDLSIDKRASLIIFRVLQEALDNTVRHAKATKVQVYLYEEEQIVHLSVIDNGIGISLQQLTDHNSFGIMGMKEKAHYLGGKLDLSRVEPCGTIVDLKFPKNINI